MSYFFICGLSRLCATLSLGFTQRRSVRKGENRYIHHLSSTNRTLFNSLYLRGRNKKNIAFFESFCWKLIYKINDSCQSVSFFNRIIILCN